MYPKAMQVNARHRREPSVRQQIRTGIGALAALALIAAFGIFSGTVPSGQTFQTEVILALPVPPRLLGWLAFALPLAGVFGLFAPTRLPRLRTVVSLALLVAGVVMLALLSRPRGVDPSAWAVPQEFAHAQTVTGFALLVMLLLGAIGATLVMALRPGDDVGFRLRRGVLWAGPVTLTVSLTAALLA